MRYQIYDFAGKTGSTWQVRLHLFITYDLVSLIVIGRRLVSSHWLTVIYSTLPYCHRQFSYHAWALDWRCLIAGPAWLTLSHNWNNGSCRPALGQAKWTQCVVLTLVWHGNHLFNIKITLRDGIVFAWQCQLFVSAVVSDNGAQALKTGEGCASWLTCCVPQLWRRCYVYQRNTLNSFWHFLCYRDYYLY